MTLTMDAENGKHCSTLTIIFQCMCMCALIVSVTLHFSFIPKSGENVHTSSSQYIMFHQF